MSQAASLRKHFASKITTGQNSQQQLIQYQRNMKIFIKAVQKQMAAIIDKYQKQIKDLKSQINLLKVQLNKKRNTNLPVEFQSQMSQCLSPIKFRGGLDTATRSIGQIEGIQTARSNFLQDFQIKNLFGTLDSVGFKTNLKESPLSYKFQIQRTPDKLGKSRFQMECKKKKQRQEELLQSLEMGKSNLQLNTDKMFTLIGRSKSIQKKDQSSQVNQQETPVRKRRASEAHNTSLNSICDSLNNSFHGRKAQAKSLKKRKQKSDKQSQQLKKQHERQKKKKQQGIKNLLTSMRNSIQVSPNRTSQVIKTSKLLSTGQKKTVQISSKAKVLINPIAVDLVQRNKQKQHSSMTTSPSKNPQSILKNSNANILSKSIQNISAISFHESGGQQ